MSAKTTADTTHQGVTWSRLGDIGLCTLLSLVAVIQIAKAYRAIAGGELLLGLNLALVCVASLILAGLPLIRRQAIAKGDQWGPKLIAIVGSFMILPLGALPITWKPNLLLGLTPIGMILAYTWIIWSLLTLRRSFSVFPEARKLIEHGPYGIVRHPLYLSYFFTYSMIALPRISIWSLLIVVIAFAAEVNRSRNEERILRAAFPEYESYAQRVRAFMPINRSVAAVNISESQIAGELDKIEARIAA